LNGYVKINSEKKKDETKVFCNHSMKLDKDRQRDFGYSNHFHKIENRNKRSHSLQDLCSNDMEINANIMEKNLDERYGDKEIIMPSYVCCFKHWLSDIVDICLRVAGVLIFM